MSFFIPLFNTTNEQGVQEKHAVDETAESSLSARHLSRKQTLHKTHRT